jgi:hypothetical protein
VDSYCDEIHYNQNDSQCFMSYNGVGPFLIQNNFIQAGAEDILFGGDDPGITGLIASDITFVGNVIQKNTAWRGQAAPLNWVIKNLFEVKNGQRILIDGNVFQDLWMAGQVGYAVVLTPRNDPSGICPQCTASDITITHNLFRHISAGVQMSNSDNYNPSQPTARVLIQNNVFDDVSATWGIGRALDILSTTGLISAHDLTIDHNTMFPDNRALALGDSSTSPNIQFTNNLSNHATYGIFGSGSSPGTASLSLYITGLTYNDNAFITATGSPAGTYPAGTFWNTQAGVQFTNFSGANYQILSTSPYHNGGTDGKDVGVWDWVCLNQDASLSLTGTFVPSSGCVWSVTLPPTGLTAIVQ